MLAPGLLGNLRSHRLEWNVLVELPCMITTNHVPSTLGSALFLAKAAAGPGAVVRESSKPPKRSTSGCGGAVGGATTDDFLVGLRTEFDLVGVCVISSSPASYSSNCRRLSLNEEPLAPIRLLLPPEL